MFYVTRTQQPRIVNTADWTSPVPVLKKQTPKYVLSNPTLSHLPNFGFVRVQ